MAVAFGQKNMPDAAKDAHRDQHEKLGAGRRVPGKRQRHRAGQCGVQRKIRYDRRRSLALREPPGLDHRAGAVTLPFAWHTPTGSELLMLVSMGIFGGIGHIFLTESYRHATASVVAPFDY